MTQQSLIQPAFPQQLPRSQQEWQNFLNQLQQALQPNTATAFKSTFTSFSTTTIQADPDLAVPITTPGTYLFEAFLYVNTGGATGNTPGFALQMTFSGTFTTPCGYTFEGFMDGGGVGGGPVNSPVPFSLLTGPGLDNALTVTGVIQCTSAGTMSVNWGQANVSASAVVINSGSYLRVTRLN